ncbi:MAG: glutaredoxin [Firmicutes bacterium]|nr:glutaredoxin [Bacillota bacterium]
MIKVYSIPDCSWCKKVKTYLTSKNVDFTDINVEDDPEGRQELMSLSPELQIPLVNINGNIVVGFNKEKLDEYLQL